MARIRTIKPEFWQDELVASWPPLSRLAYIAMWNEADDEGRLRASTSYLQSRIFPYEAGLDFESVLAPIINTGRIVLYNVDGQTYGELLNFKRHQRINRPTESKLPQLTESSLNNHGAIMENSLNNHPQLTVGKEGKGKELRAPDPGNENLTGTPIPQDVAPARVNDASPIAEAHDPWGFLEDELGTSETEPAPLGQESQERAPVSHFENPLIDEAIAAMGAPVMCTHQHTIVTSQGEVDRDRTCTDCGLTWIEAREYTSAPVATQPKPKRAKPEAKKVEPMPTMAEAVEVDPAQLPVITPPMLEKIVEGLQKLGPQALEKPVAEPFQPGPRASGMVVQELLDNCKTHSINPDSIWLYAVQKGYARPGADGSRNWMSLSEHGAGRFLNLMQPAKLRGLKEHLRTHFENGVTA